MRLLLLCKRQYTNRDLLDDRYGRLYHLPVQLAHFGHDVIVLAADYVGRHSESMEESGVHFETSPMSVARFASFFRWAQQRIDQFQPDAVMASGDTYLGVMGKRLSKGLPFIFDVYDDYRVFRSGRIPLMNRAFRDLIKKADLTTVASSPLRSALSDLNESVVVIQNGVDRRVFTPMEAAVARASAGVQLSPPILGFFGTLGPNRGIEDLLAATYALRKKNIEASLLMAGARTVDVDLSEAWIDYRGVTSQTVIPLLIGASDVVVIPYRRDPQIDVSNASKLPEYLACGVPIVTTRVSDYAQLYGLPDEITCEPGDVEGLGRAINYQLTHRITVDLPSQFEWHSLGRKLEAALLRLT